MRDTHPKKRPSNDKLKVTEEAHNKKISSDGIIVENIFGQLCGLWTLKSAQWHWSESLYDELFKFAMEFTNFHVKWMLIRADDRHNFNNCVIVWGISDKME